MHAENDRDMIIELPFNKEVMILRLTADYDHPHNILMRKIKECLLLKPGIEMREGNVYKSFVGLEVLNNAAKDFRIQMLVKIRKDHADSFHVGLLQLACSCIWHIFQFPYGSLDFHPRFLLHRLCTG